MDDLIAFLRARIDEDEQAAWHVLAYSRESYDHDPPERWKAVRTGPEKTILRVQTFRGENLRTYPIVDLDPLTGQFLGRYLERFDPDRALREAATKRRILDEHAIVDTNAIGEDMRVVRIKVCQVCGNRRGVPCDTVRLLALSYSGHSDYREEWKP